MMDLRAFISRPERISGASVNFGIAKALLSNPSKTLYFKDVEESSFDVVGNIITGRESVYRALGTDRKSFTVDVNRFYENPLKPVIVKKGVCQEKECKLEDLPILNHFEKDGGRYITSGIVVANDPEYGRNSSIHRLMLKEDNLLGIRIVPRHLNTFLERAEKRDEDLEVAIVIGVHPREFFSASSSPPLGYDEFSLAGSIRKEPVELVKCKTVDVEVPAYSEIVIEGKIIRDLRSPEGPFADVTGTYDRVREQPVVEVHKITHRKNAVYHALLPSGIEHRLYMGMPREPGIYNSVKEVADLDNACLTDGGRNWLQGVISLRRGRWDMKKVIERAFEGHPSMKHVIIVDDEIDIFNPDQIEYAISTRFQAHRDAYVYRDMKGSTLDPSTDEDGKTTKVGIDATKTPGREEDYEFARIP